MDAVNANTIDCVALTVIYFCIAAFELPIMPLVSFNNIASISASQTFFFLAMFCTSATTQWSLGSSVVSQHEGPGFYSLVEKGLSV